MSVQNLDLYYQYLFPYEQIVQWLTYNGTRPLNHRELSFQYQGDAVQRYVIFNNAQTMKQRMTSRFQQMPVKLDAGAIWSQIPKKDSPGKTQERQLIFDFDMNDYDDVRNCCQGKKICKKCWRLLIIAIEIIRTTLEQDYDLHNFMYVFSGGRGVHIWVCDQRARKIKDSVRRSLVDYLQLVTGNQKADSMLSQNAIRPIQKLWFNKSNNIDTGDRQQLKKHQIRHYFPYHVERSLKILKNQNFLQIFKQQQALQHEKGRKIIQKILKSRSQKLKNRILQRWNKCPNETQALYAILLEQVDLYQQGNIINKNNVDYPMQKPPKNKEYKNLTFIQEQIMLTFLYPRMDYNVSTSQNHLLKLPFSIHPTSHKVSVPIFSYMVRDFDPDSRIIKFETLLQELKQLSDKDGSQNLTREKAMSQCSLVPFIRALRQFTQSISK